jgi:hypothetical protein
VGVSPASNPSSLPGLSGQSISSKLDHPHKPGGDDSHGFDVPYSPFNSRNIPSAALKLSAAMVSVGLAVAEVGNTDEPAM